MIPAITIHSGECIQYLVPNPQQSHVQFCLNWTEQVCQEWEKKPFFLRGLWSLSWVPASVQVLNTGLVCVCWSVSRPRRATDHMQDLKKPNRLVITANHDGRMYGDGGLQMSISLTVRRQDSLTAHQKLFHSKVWAGFSGSSQLLLILPIHSWWNWSCRGTNCKDVLFLGEIAQCKLADVAWGAAVWRRGEN